MPTKAFKNRLAKDIFDIGAVRFGAFRLKLHDKNPSAPLSPIFFNLRTPKHPTKPGPVSSDVLYRCVNLMLELAGDFEFYTGLPYAGESFADAIENLSKSFDNKRRRVRLRKKDNDDGTREIVEILDSVPKPGSKVIIFDDLVTGANTIIESIEVIESQGLIVDKVVVLIDRMQGGRQKLEEMGYTVKSVFTVTELLDYYAETGAIDKDMSLKVRKYLRLG